jgi:hypothetical protein
MTILNELSHDLVQSDFNLEAWKIKAKLVLKTLFGKEDERIAMIEQLHYDYSSWSLRDNSGGKIIDPVKMTANEIVNSARIDLEIKQEGNSIEELLSQELTGSQFNKLRQIINNRENVEIEEFISELDIEVLKKIVVAIIRSAFTNTLAD